MYDPGLLRSFVAVAHTLSFTQAALQLGLSQPTVSQHVRRLEAAVGRQLFVRDTRTVLLTADGERMADFARTILSAHETAAAYFAGNAISGRLRFGVSDDLALTPVPRILRDFRQSHPRIDLELTVAQNTALQRRIESGHLDVGFIKEVPGKNKGTVVRRDRWAWVGAPGLRLEPDRPIPLVLYQSPSISRALGIQALDRAAVSYRIVCTVRDLLGAVAAIRAGLGFGIFARSLVPEGLAELPSDMGLPDIGEIDLVLLINPRNSSAAAEALTRAILGTGNPLRA